MNKKTKAVIIIDGDCVMCNTFAKWVNKRDKTKYFHFSDQYSDFFKDNVFSSVEHKPKSIILIQYKNLKPIVFKKMKAVEGILQRLGFPYNFFSFLLKFIPFFIKNTIYSFIAKYRKVLFKKERCSINDVKQMKDYILN